MSAQKPESWVNSLINRFEEQLPVKTGLKTAQSRSTLDLHKDCLVQVSRVKFVLVINGLTRILQNINSTRIIGEEAERTLFESQIIILDTLEECLSVYPLRDTTRVEEAKILSILLPEICQFLLYVPPHSNDPLQNLLRASASDALYAMSRTSFSVIFAKISSRLQALVDGGGAGGGGSSSNTHYSEASSGSGMGLSDAGDLHSSFAGDLELIQYIHVDRAVLTKLLNELVSKLRHLRNKSHVPPSLVVSVEKSIWNYVETYPTDYMQHQKEPEEELADACEKLFDIFNETAEGSSKRKAQVWPLQMLLMLFSPKALEEIVNADNGAPISAKHLKKKLYIDAVRKSLQGHGSASSKQLHEGAVVSCVKLCKASTYIDTRDSTNVTFVLVQNVQAELKSTLFNAAKPFSRGPALAQADIDLMVDAFVAFFHINPHNTDILKACLPSAAMSAHLGHSPSSSIIFHLALIQALHRIIIKPRLKFWPAIEVWYNKLGELRTLFIDTLNRVMNGSYHHHHTGHHTALKFAHSFNIKDKVQTQFKQALKASDANKPSSDDVVNHRAVLSNIVKLIYTDPTMFLHNASKAQVHDLISGLVSVVSQAFLPPDLSADCMEALLKLHQTRNIMLWNPDAPVVTFWEISSSILFSICQNLLQHVIPNYTDVLLWLKQTLACRNCFLEQQHNKDTHGLLRVAINNGSATPMARQAHIKLEAVLFSYLWSIDMEAILVAMSSFGLMCNEAKIRAPDEYALQLMMPNHDTYMDLAEASQGLATGRAQLQKRLLTILRKMEVPTPGLQQSWDETYRCWEEALKFFNHYPKQGERPSRRRFTSMMLAHTSLDHELDDYFAEWQNMTGFLCALGGVCVQRRSPLHAPTSIAVSATHSVAGGASSSGSGLWTTTSPAANAATNDPATLLSGSSASLTSSFVTIDGPSSGGGGSLSNSNAPSPRTRAPLLSASMGGSSTNNSTSIGGTTTTTTTTILPSSSFGLLEPVLHLAGGDVGSSSSGGSSSATRHYCPVTEFLRHMLIQLTCQNEKFGAKVQKQIRDSLAHELHEALYPALFEQLRVTIDKFLDSAPQSGGKVLINFANTAFIEHSISIIIGILMRSTTKSPSTPAVVPATVSSSAVETGAGNSGRNVANLTPTANEPSSSSAILNVVGSPPAVIVVADGGSKPSRLSSFPIDAVVLNIARYCRNLDASGYSQHIKVRFCGLCEEIMARREMLYFRSELRFRNRLLDCISDWVLGSTSHYRVVAALANVSNPLATSVPAGMVSAGYSSASNMPSVYAGGSAYQQQQLTVSPANGMMLMVTSSAGGGSISGGRSAVAISGDAMSGLSSSAGGSSSTLMSSMAMPMSNSAYLANSSGIIMPNASMSAAVQQNSQQFYPLQSIPLHQQQQHMTLLPPGSALLVPTSTAVSTGATTAAVAGTPAVALDLDLAAVRAIAHILHELPLQAGDNERGDIADAKSQLFLKYFTLLMNILNECQQNLNLAALLNAAAAAATAQSNNIILSGYAAAAAAAAGVNATDGNFIGLDAQQQQQILLNYSMLQQQQVRHAAGFSGNYRQQILPNIPYYPQYYAGAQNTAQMQQLVQLQHQQQLQQQQKNTMLEKQTRVQQQAWEQLRAFSIQAMSNLLSANVEHGLVHAVPLGYHADVQTRVAFIEVLTQILQQGTQFETLAAENAVAERYTQLVDLLVMQDERGQFPMARALADSMPNNNTDSAAELARVLVSLFDARNLLMPLLASVFRNEVETHDDYMTLFRGNNLATKIMASCSIQFGRSYWFSLLASHVQQFVANLTGGGGAHLPLAVAVEQQQQLIDVAAPQADGMIEVGIGIGGVFGASGAADGLALGQLEAETQNFRHLERASTAILDAICASAARMPEKLKLMFTIMHASIADRFAEPRPLSVVTTIMFLRYINPAIVSPKENGLLDRQPSLNVKHGLINVSKIVQAAAGGNEFPSEHNLRSFNPLIKRYADRIRGFCANITTWTPPPPPKIASVSLAEPLLLVDADEDDTDASDVDDNDIEIDAAETLQQQQPPLVSKLNSRQQQQQNAWKSNNNFGAVQQKQPLLVNNNGSTNPPPIPSAYISEVDVITLHRLMWSAQDRIGDYLSANYRNHHHHYHTHHSATHTMSAVSGRGPYDKLVTLLAYLGPPEQRSFDTWSPPGLFGDAAGSGGAQFEEFWQKHRIQDREEFKCMKSLNVFYQAGKSAAGYPVFYYIARKYLIQQHHPDMLLYQVLMTIKPFQHMRFDLVIDLTHCCSENRFKTEVLQKWMCVLPREAIDNVNNIYVYNTSTWVKEYTKFHERVLAPIKQHRIIFCDSVSKLNDYLSSSTSGANLPASTSQLEEDLKVYTDALKLSNNKDMRCFIKLSPQAVQIQACERTKVLGQPVVLNDVYYASEIDEVILVDDNQFTLTIQQESGPLSFIHEQCEELVQGIIHIRTRWELSQPDQQQQQNQQAQQHATRGGICVPAAAGHAGSGQAVNLYSTNHRQTSSIKPKAVPGMLLNICLLNLGSSDALLRSAAYNLLCVLAETFHMKLEGQLLETGGLCIPANNTNFIKSVSEKLARQESSYTLDFLDEVVNGFKSSPIQLKHLILEYSPPWLLNLPQFLKSPSLMLAVPPTVTVGELQPAFAAGVAAANSVDAVNNLNAENSVAVDQLHPAATNTATCSVNAPGSLVLVESKRQKVTNIIDRFITLTLEDEDGIYAAIIAKIWGTLGQLPDMIDVVLDQFLKRSVTQGLGSPASELLADTTVALASASRDKLVSRKIVERTLRVLEKTCISPAWQFEQHLMFEDVGILLRYLLMLSFNNQIDVIDNFPYLLHVITMLMCCGPVAMRASVHGLAINTIHSLLTCSCAPLSTTSASSSSLSHLTTFNDDTQRALRLSLTEFSLPKFHGYFGLRHNIFSACKTTAFNAFQSTDLFAMRSGGTTAAAAYASGAGSVYDVSAGFGAAAAGGNSPTGGAQANIGTSDNNNSAAATSIELNLCALETVCDAFLELVEVCEKDSANRMQNATALPQAEIGIKTLNGSRASLNRSGVVADDAEVDDENEDDNNELAFPPHSPTVATTPTLIGAAAVTCAATTTISALADVRQWHTQWLALAKSFAMRYNPALQPRALVVYGAIAKQATDRDVKTLLRLLVKALESFNHLALINALIMCMTRLQPLLPPDSPIHKALFWVAICVLQLDEVSLYASGLALLEENLRTLDALGYFTQQQPPLTFDRVLMSTREPLEWQYFKQLDHASGMSFKANFHFALVGHLIKAYRHPSLDVRKRVVCILNMLLNIIAKQSMNTSAAAAAANNAGETSSTSSIYCVSRDTVPYLIALLPVAEEVRQRCRLQYKQSGFSIQYVMAQNAAAASRAAAMKQQSGNATAPRSMSTIQRPLANTRPYSVDVAEPRASMSIAGAGVSVSLAASNSAAAAFALNKARSSDFADYGSSSKSSTVAAQQPPALPQYHRYPVTGSSSMAAARAANSNNNLPDVAAGAVNTTSSNNAHAAATAVLSAGSSSLGGARSSAPVLQAVKSIAAAAIGLNRPSSQPPTGSQAARAAPSALLSLQMLQQGGGSFGGGDGAASSSGSADGNELSASRSVMQSASSSPGGDTLMPGGGGDASSRKHSSASSSMGGGADLNNDAVLAPAVALRADNFLLDANILNDYQTQALTLSLLATLVRHTNDENEARVLYQYLAEGSAVFPKVFPIIHSLLDVKVNGVLQLCHDAITLAAVQAIIQNMIIYDSQEHQGAVAAAAAAASSSSVSSASFPPPTMQCIGFGGLWRFAGPFNKTGSSADNSELFVNCLEAMVETCLPADDDEDDEVGGTGAGGGDFYVDQSEIDSDYSRGTTYPVDSSGSVPQSPSTINSFEMQQQQQQHRTGGGASGGSDMYTHFN